MAPATSFVAVAGVLFAMAPFGIDMYLPALPDMARALASNIDAVETSVAVFLLGYAMLFTMARCGLLALLSAFSLSRGGKSWL